MSDPGTTGSRSGKVEHVGIGVPDCAARHHLVAPASPGCFVIGVGMNNGHIKWCSFLDYSRPRGRADCRGPNAAACCDWLPYVNIVNITAQSTARSEKAKKKGNSLINVAEF